MISKSCLLVDVLVVGLESLRINRGILILVGVNSIKLFNDVYSIMNTFFLVFCIYLL